MNHKCLTEFHNRSSKLIICFVFSCLLSLSACGRVSLSRAEAIEAVETTKSNQGMPSFKKPTVYTADLKEFDDVSSIFNCSFSSENLYLHYRSISDNSTKETIEKTYEEIWIYCKNEVVFSVNDNYFGKTYKKVAVTDDDKREKWQTFVDSSTYGSKATEMFSLQSDCLVNFSTRVKNIVNNDERVDSEAYFKDSENEYDFSCSFGVGTSSMAQYCLSTHGGLCTSFSLLDNGKKQNYSFRWGQYAYIEPDLSSFSDKT